MSICVHIAGSSLQSDSKLAMAVGSRAHLELEALARRHWFRNFLMRGFHLLVMFVAGGAVRDTQCGFKVGPFKLHQHTDVSCCLMILCGS